MPTLALSTAGVLTWLSRAARTARSRLHNPWTRSSTRSASRPTPMATPSRGDSASSRDCAEARSRRWRIIERRLERIRRRGVAQPGSDRRTQSVAAAAPAAALRVRRASSSPGDRRRFPVAPDMRGRLASGSDENRDRWLLFHADRSGKRQALPRLGGRPLWCCPVNLFRAGGTIRNG